MKSYCVKQKKQTECVPGSETTVKTKNGRTMMKCKCAECGATKTRFVKTSRGGAIGPLALAKAMYELPQKIFPSTKKTFNDYWSGKIAKDAFNTKTGLFSKTFWKRPHWEGNKYIIPGGPTFVSKK